MSLNIIFKRINALKNLQLLKYAKPKLFKPPIITRNNYVAFNNWPDDINSNQTEKDKSTDFEKISEIAKLLKCSNIIAMKLIAKNKKLLRKRHNLLAKDTKFLTDHLDLTDIITNPKVLTLSPGYIDQHYYILQEVGLRNIKASSLILFYQIMSKNVEELKRMELIQLNVDPLENMLRILGNDSELCSQIKYNLSFLSDDHQSISVHTLRHVIVCTYLGFKLGITIEEVMKRFSTYSSVKNRSLSNLTQIFNILENNGYPMEKLTNNIFILSGDPKNITELMKLGLYKGIDFKSLIFKNAYLFICKSQNMLFNAELMFQNGFTAEQIMDCPRILGLSPETIVKRLKDLHQIPELGVMRFHPKFIHLINSYNTAVERLENLKSEGFSTFSISCLVSSENNFKAKKQYGSDTNTGSEMVYYLSHFFNKSNEEIKKQLSKHPRSRKHRNAVNMETNCKFLLNSGVTKEQLWNSLPVIFYSEKLVAEIFTNIERYVELEPFEEWRKHPLLLDLVIYYIEKRSGFNGDGALRLH